MISRGGLEPPNGDVSTYTISNQISGFLTMVEEPKLAVNPQPIVDISGNWKGTIANKDTGAPMGLFEIDIYSKPQANGQTGWLGMMTLDNGSPAAVQLPIVNFTALGAGSGIISAYATFSMMNGMEQATVSLTGKINGSTLLGVVSPSDHAGVTGAITLVKGGDFPPNAPMPPTTIEPTYSGKTQIPCAPGQQPTRAGQCQANISLSIGGNIFDPSTDFLNNFLTMKLVHLSLEFDVSGGPASMLTVDGARLDPVARTLTYQGVPSPGAAGSVSLSCVDDKRGGFNCNFAGSTNSYTFEVDPYAGAGLL